jgi:hypothetical protein
MAKGKVLGEFSAKMISLTFVGLDRKYLGAIVAMDDKS